MQEKSRYYLVYDLQLFAKDGPDGEKTEEPTAKKLEDARNKGQVMRSTEVVTAATLLVKQIKYGNHCKKHTDPYSNTDHGISYDRNCLRQCIRIHFVN